MDTFDDEYIFQLSDTFANTEIATNLFNTNPELLTKIEKVFNTLKSINGVQPGCKKLTSYVNDDTNNRRYKITLQ